MNQIKIGDIGVCLSDHDETGNLYMVDSIWGDDKLIAVKVDHQAIVKTINKTDFWALTNILLPI